MAQHYEAVADVLRDYLEAHGVPARELTTTELRWAMPPALMTGSGRRFAEVFEAADLVKFAHWRPGVAQAEGFVRAAEELLQAVASSALAGGRGESGERRAMNGAPERALGV